MTIFTFLRSTVANIREIALRTEGPDHEISVLSMQDASEVFGGMPVPDPEQTSNDGDDENDEGNEGDDATAGGLPPVGADSADGSCGGYACGADGGADEADVCGADACAVDAGPAMAGDDGDADIGADLAAGLDIDMIDPGV